MLWNVLKIVSVMVGAGLLGKLFLDEVTKAKIERKPWYTPYLTPPGILVVFICIGLPVVLWWIQNG